MTEPSLRVLAVLGSLSEHSSSRTVLVEVAERLRKAGCEVDVLDFRKEPLPLFDPEVSYKGVEYASLKSRVVEADVLLLATPDYHGSMSSALKNFLDHFWKEYAGKLFASVVASYEKGLTVTDQIRTVARQCYAWSLPYGVAFADRQDLQEGGGLGDDLRNRVEMLVRDIRVYGKLLASQRRADLAGAEPGFLARYRPPSR